MIVGIRFIGSRKRRRQQKQIEGLAQEVKTLEAEHHQHMQKLESQHQDHVKSLVAEHQRELVDLTNQHQDQIGSLVAEHQRELANLGTEYRRELDAVETAQEAKLRSRERERWCRRLATYRWLDSAPEVEVEAKLVFPLLWYLGYQEGEMTLRVPVTLVEGSRQQSLQADWVVQDAVFGPLLVVEAKAPNKQLDESVQNQARSYAFYLGAPVYIVTNGKQVQIFHRHILSDHRKISCETARLGEVWSAVQESAGKEHVVELKRQLSDSG